MSPDPTGKSLELAVARIQQLLDPNSVVTHDEFILDRLGIRRQFDVVVRGKAAGRDYLAVIEAKDWAQRVGTPEVDAFLTKANNVKANIMMMVSRKGFSEPALVQAKHCGLGTLSLLPNDSIDAGFTIGVECILLVYRWHNYSFEFQYLKRQDTTGISKGSVPTLEGKKVINWVFKQLETHHSGQIEDARIEVSFEVPVHLDFDGELQAVTSMKVKVARSLTAKKGMVQLKGDGYFDWQTMALSDPFHRVDIEITEETFNSWEKYEGEIPCKEGFNGLVIRTIFPRVYSEAEVPDLEKYL